MERFGFIQQKKGEWVCVKTSNGPWCQYEQVELVLAEKDREIANLQKCQCEGCDESLEGEAYCQSCLMNLREAYHALMAKAVRFAEYLQETIDCGDVGGLGMYEQVQSFLTSPKVRAWREQQEGL